MKGTSIKLAVFTVFTIFITFWLASVIGNIQPFSSTYSVTAVFTDATGVLNGDLVKIAGVNVGKVTDFKVAQGNAAVTMEVSGDVKLPRNVIADIKFRNLLGQRVINLIRPENPASDNLADGGVIPITQTRPALDLSVVFDNLRPLIQTTNPQDINSVSRAILAVFKGHEDEFAQLLSNVGKITNTLADRGQRLGRFITDLNQLAKILNNESGSIRQGLDRFTELMEALADVTPTIGRVVDQLDAASTKFGGVLARNHSNLNQELQDLSSILTLVNNNLGPLDKIAKNLKEVLLATARTQSYGRWWNLYVVNLCLEGFPHLPELANLPNLNCQR